MKSSISINWRNTNVFENYSSQPLGLQILVAKALLEKMIDGKREGLQMTPIPLG